MTIKEVEERTGLSRSNVRFYEKEGLIAPSRNEKNGYRDYSKSDIESIKKIAYLRTLGVSVEDIRNIIEEKEGLHKVIQRQSEILKTQISDLNRAKTLCERMLRSNAMSYEEFQVEEYVGQLQEYWDDNKRVLRYLIRPVMYAKLQMGNAFGEIITEYLTNYLCFVALSVEIFSILFLYGVVKNIVAVLFVDAVVLLGMLAVGIVKMDLRK